MGMARVAVYEGSDQRWAPAEGIIGGFDRQAYMQKLIRKIKLMTGSYGNAIYLV